MGTERNTIFLILPGILFVIGYVPYIIDIVRHKTRPATASWLIWAVMDAITFAGLYAEHAANALIIGALSGSVLVALLSLRYGTSGWSWIDKACLGGAALSLLLWAIFNSPFYGLMTALTVNLIAAIPTFVSTWADASRENRYTWVFFWIASALSVLAVRSWTLVDAAQPLSFLLVQTIMLYLLFVHRPMKKGARR